MSLRADEEPQQPPTRLGHSGPAVSLQPDRMPVQPSASGYEGPQPRAPWEHLRLPGPCHLCLPPCPCLGNSLMTGTSIFHFL